MIDSSQTDDPKTMQDAIAAIILNREQRIDDLVASEHSGNAVLVAVIRENRRVVMMLLPRSKDESRVPITPA